MRRLTPDPVTITIIPDSFKICEWQWSFDYRGKHHYGFEPKAYILTRGFSKRAALKSAKARLHQLELEQLEPKPEIYTYDV